MIPLLLSENDTVTHVVRAFFNASIEQALAADLMMDPVTDMPTMAPYAAPTMAPYAAPTSAPTTMAPSDGTALPCIVY